MLRSILTNAHNLHRPAIAALALLISSTLSVAQPQALGDPEARLQALVTRLGLRSEQIEPARQVMAAARAARQAMAAADRAQRQRQRDQIDAQWRKILSTEQMQALEQWRQENPPARGARRAPHAAGKRG